MSRVDTKVDDALEAIGREDRGRAAVANAKIAYESFQRIFSGERWRRLERAGAHVQRPLWGSTSTKNPDYPDTLYVDELIGPHTVNTMPDATIEAARDHATAARTVDRDVEAAHAVMRDIREAGVDVDDIVLRELVDEGVDAFAASYDSLLEALEEKEPGARVRGARIAVPADEETTMLRISEGAAQGIKGLLAAVSPDDRRGIRISGGQERNHAGDYEADPGTGARQATGPSIRRVFRCSSIPARRRGSADKVLDARVRQGACASPSRTAPVTWGRTEDDRRRFADERRRRGPR